jgi:hypothetical protein
MIVTEHRLRDLVNLFPSLLINGNERSIFFGWGTKDELLRTQKEYMSSIYPLIWLLPTNEKYNTKTKKTVKNCVFIISTIEDSKEYLNSDRYIRSFDYVLNPLADRLVECIDKSNVTRLLSEVDILKYPNYSDESLDSWDALKLEIEVEFNDNCIREIKWQK